MILQLVKFGSHEPFKRLFVMARTNENQEALIEREQLRGCQDGIGAGVQGAVLLRCLQPLGKNLEKHLLCNCFIG